METDLVSIIMPVHNCCKYIVQAIISVKMQTYKKASTPKDPNEIKTDKNE